MSKLDHAIWWQVYPLGACGTDMFDPASKNDQDSAQPAHALRKLEAWLDYAIELGCSGLLLGPIFQSSAHGYDTTDHLKIDKRLGDDADFDHFMAECNRRGLMVMLDGVFNHVGTAHPLVGESIVKAKRGEPTLVKTHEHEGEIVSVPWEGNLDLAELDHSNPEVADMVTDIMLHWLRRGIAGWRLDAAYSVPTEFWATVIDRVRADFPDAIFLGEIIHGGQAKGAETYTEFAMQSHVDSFTQYEVWKAIWSSIQNTNLWELQHALGRHQEFMAAGAEAEKAVQSGQEGVPPHDYLPLTFVGNHDVSRIASEVGDNGAVLAATVLFTIPGMPSIYYGDEQGFRGEKGDGFYADASIRPSLPDTPDGLAKNGEWLHRIYQQLIGIRRQNPWVARGELRVENVEENTITFATTDGTHTLRTLINLEPDSTVVTVDDKQVFYWEQKGK